VHGSVDDPYPGLDHAQLPVADEPRRLGAARQVHADEVGLREQFLEAHQADAELGRARRRHVRVIGDQRHAEGREALSDQHPDLAEAEDPRHLVLQLDAGKGGPLPLPALQRGHGLGHVPRGREQQRDGVLGGADDVGRRGVDHHHAAPGRRLDVDVVQADAGPGDHAQLRRVVQGLGVDGGRAADDHRIGVGQGRQQLGPVAAVGMTDLEVGLQLGNPGGRELFGDEDDRRGHVSPFRRQQGTKV